MTPLLLKLVYTQRVQQAAAAVLLPGPDAESWLAWTGELRLDDESSCRMSSCRLLPLADPRNGGAVVGALCFLSHPESDPHSTCGTNIWDCIDRRCPRYGCVQQRLFLPIEARLSPPVADSEWHELLPADDSIMVWHPQLGLIRYEPSQVLTVADLYSRPDSRPADWHHAEPGPVLNRRLYSILVESPPDLDVVLQSGREDIGSQSDNLHDLPKTDNEPSIPWKQVALAPLIPLAALASWLADKLKEAKSGSTGGAGTAAGAGGGMLGGLASAISSKLSAMIQGLAAITPNLLREREREIERLLDKLRRDPDEGLKYALPMDDGLGRGVAAPGSRLASRSVDFSLRGQGSGGPADVWNLSAEVRARLMASYREAAAREVRLGRFRRAAYIYASLLGDYQTAANVLEQGRHFREAAAVYKEKLHRPADAARCLENGGLLEEAIAVYDVTGQHLKVGELYERLDRPDDARAAYLRAIGDRMQRQDRLGAADLWENRLSDPDEALHVLEEGWPASAQAQRCLEQYFSVTDRLKRLPQSLNKIEQLRTQLLSERHQSDLVAVMATVSRAAKDRQVMDRAADTARLVASKVLQRIPDSPRILRALAELAPEDRLLQRDCSRFRRTQPEPAKSAKGPITQSKTVTGTKVGEILHTLQVTWNNAVSTGTHGFLVGHNEQQEVFLTRLGWAEGGNSSSTVYWNQLQVADLDRPAPLLVDVQTPATVHVGLWNCLPLAPRSLRVTDDLPFEMTAGTPSWLDRFTSVLDGHHLSSYTCDVRGKFRQFDRLGNPVAEHQLEYGELVEPEQTVPWTSMHARPREVYVGHGTTLYRIRDGESPERYQMPGWITGIAGSAPHARCRLIVTHSRGASLFSPTFQDWGETVLEKDVSDLMGCLLQDGRALLWRPHDDGSGTLSLYSILDDRVLFLGSTHRAASGTNSWIRFMLPTSQRNQVALIPRSSQAPIELWQFPGW